MVVFTYKKDSALCSAVKAAGTSRKKRSTVTLAPDETGFDRPTALEIFRDPAK